MKWLLLLSIGSFCSVSLRADRETVSHVAVLAAHLDRVEGCAAGDAAVPGRFYLFARLVMRDCREGDIESLLSNNSPVVRLLGYQCALALRMKIADQLEKELLADTTEVLYFPFGCVGGKSRIGQVAREIKSNPRLLLDGPKK